MGVPVTGKKQGGNKMSAKQISNSALKTALYKELEIKVDLSIQGISYVPADLKKFHIGTEYAEQIHVSAERDRHPHVGVDLPMGFHLPLGLYSAFRWDPESPYRLEAEDGKPVILKYSYHKPPVRIGEVKFYKRPKLLEQRTSDGMSFSRIATFTTEGAVNFFYSNECSLKDKGDDCLFCNVNSTGGVYRKDKVFIKNPRQIGEVAAAAYKAGIGNKFQVSGGFVSERREIDYYADVAEEIRKQTGLSDFNGNPNVGAPLDFSIIEKYKEVGFSSIASNIEVWDKNIWKAICPGKDRVCGGWDNWIKSLEYMVKVFGRGKVRSNIVAGIESKKSVLEGVEYLSDKGICCFAGAWCPNPGSALEGHRTPETEWHLDKYYKVAAIYKRKGYTLNELFSAVNASTPVHDIYRIEEEQFEGSKLKEWKFPLQGKKQ
jgi:hypothetical protein